MEKRKSIYSTLVIISVVLSIAVSGGVSLILRKMISSEITSMKKIRAQGKLRQNARNVRGPPEKPGEKAFCDSRQN